jgi:Zn-dependent protease
MLRISGKIPITIHPLFWILVAFLSIINGQTVPEILILGIVIFFSILFHELGHAVTALFFGQKAEIELVMFGGLTKRSGPKIPLWKDFLVTMNGPCAGFLLFLAASYFKSALHLEKSNNLLNYTLQAAIGINLIWTILNLLPVQPLDGGRLLSIIFESLFGVRGIKIALAFSIALAFVGGLFFFSIGALWPGAIFLIIGFESLRNWKSSWSMTEEDRNDHLVELFHSAEKEFQAGKIEEAVKKFQEVQKSTSSGVIHAESTRYLAKYLADTGKAREAFSLLLSIEKELRSEDLPDLQLLAFLSNDWKRAVEFGQKAYREMPNHEIAFINALSFAKLHQEQAMITWLSASIRDGLPDKEEALNNSDFDLFRKNPAFEQLYHEK